MLKIISRGSRSPENAEFDHFAASFPKDGKEIVPRIITHMHSHCSAHIYLLFSDLPVAVVIFS